MSDLSCSESSSWIEGHFYKGYDMHCPLMGSGLNTYREKCLGRQDGPTQPDCYGGCKAVGESFASPEREAA